MTRRPERHDAPEHDPADRWRDAGATPTGRILSGRLAVTMMIAAVMLAFAAYIPALDNEFLQWDDKQWILDVDGRRGFGTENLVWIFGETHFGHYQPLTWLSYGVDLAIWGTDEAGQPNPTGFFLTNVLLHSINAALVFCLALGLLRRAFAGTRLHEGVEAIWAALFVALLFALHPLRVESVAWATERRDVLSASFVLLTFLTYLKAVAPETKSRTKWLTISVVIFAISMLAKVGGAPLPVMLLILDWYPLRRFGRTARSWFRRESIPILIEKIPYFVIALGFSYFVIRNQTETVVYPLDQHSIFARCMQACFGLVFYVWKTVLPIGLTPLYEFLPPLDTGESRFLVSAIIVAAVVVLGLYSWKRMPAVVAAALTYAALVGPLLGFFQNGPQLVADRYSYLSTLGWLILAGGGLALWMRRMRGETGRVAPLPLVVAGLVVAGLGAMTIRQNRHWHDDQAFWARMVEVDPGGSYSNNGYGYLILDAGRPAEALPHFETALARKSANREAHFNLWRAMRELGRSEADLIEAYRRGLRSGIREVVADASFKLGGIALAQGRNEDALALYRQFLGLTETANGYSNLAIVLRRLERDGEAFEALRRAIELDTNHVQARYQLGNLYYEQEQYSAAIAQYDKVLQIRPGHQNAQEMIRRAQQAGG